MIEQLDKTCNVIPSRTTQGTFLPCGLNIFSGAFFFFFDRCVVLNIYSIAKHEK